MAAQFKNKKNSICSLLQFFAPTLSSIKGFSLLEVLVAVGLMAFLAVYIGMETGKVATGHEFYKTAYRMEAIKEAIVGRPHLYCNGVRQFTGYVSDAGNLPDLFYTNDSGDAQRVTRSEVGRTEALEADQGLAAALLAGYRPQPKGLWAQVGNLPAWRYHPDKKLWAGWRGPYLDPPSGGALRDAWGNRFWFVVGDVIGHEGKTYRCRQTYTATRDNQHKPSETRAYWEVIAETEMNFRTWQDLGTAAVIDQEGNLIESDYIPEEHMRTEQEVFYGDSCLTIISLGRDGIPGGNGLDEDLYITIEPAEFTGEVAGNAGDSGTGNLLARKICLYVPDYTSEGGEVRRLCIPENRYQLDDNSRFFEYQPQTGDVSSTGINFRFGAEVAFFRDCLSWECEATDGFCTCSDYETVGCIQAECTNSYLQTTPDDCTCTECFMDLGTPPNCVIACQTAQCSSTTDNWDCSCLEYETGDCVEWSCSDPVANGGCECSLWSDPKKDDTNTLNKDITIGIRTILAETVDNSIATNPEGTGTIKVDTIDYPIAVHPGGNWIGTVGGI
jgi:prepilin-type N-terminal cleavage/methylation domain-containing protein